MNILLCPSASTHVLASHHTARRRSESPRLVARDDARYRGSVPPTRIRTVCLDFDKTLGTTVSPFCYYVAAGEELGIPVDAERLDAVPLNDAWAPWMTELGPVHREESHDEASFRALRAALHRARLEGAGVEADAAALDRLAERIADLEHEPAYYRLYDDTLPALDRLARAGVQAVVVSNHVWRLPELVRALGCSARFEGVVTSARVGVRKPHPEIFEAALRLAGGAPDETLMVGDSLRDDVDGARRVGMRAVLIDRDGTRAGVPADVPVIRSLLEVPLEWT
jgi:putative hydrolase of the HAD superfamily